MVQARRQCQNRDDKKTPGELLHEHICNVKWHECCKLPRHDDENEFVILLPLSVRRQKHMQVVMTAARLLNIDLCCRIEAMLVSFRTRGAAPVCNFQCFHPWNLMSFPPFLVNVDNG
jgi:hypothetical protein